MTETSDTLLDRFGGFLAGRLQEASSGYEPYTPSDPDTLRRVLIPGDILLIEGNLRISATIKYLTQSTWSHSALYIGDALPEPKDGSERPRLIEVNLGEGCVAVPLSKYRTYNTRICRANGLSPDDRDHVVNFMLKRLGLKYDLKNIADMLRYFFPVPMPVRWRRRALAFGSGRSYARHMFLADRPGLRRNSLSDPAGDHAGAPAGPQPSLPIREARYCTSATTHFIRHATSIFRPTSASSSRRSSMALTTRT